jgi:hypothetical protein
MNIKAFFVDALTSALDMGIGTPADVVRYITPDILAAHLPRPLWARLLTACLGAPRVDAQLVIETIGIPNLCEHVPASIVWPCIAEIGARSLGKTPDVPVSPAPLPRQSEIRSGVIAPPPEARPVSSPEPGPVAIGPSIPAPTPTPAVNQPLADLITELQEEKDDPKVATVRPRSPTAQRFRQSGTGLNRLTGRRPQAAALPTTRPKLFEETGDLETNPSQAASSDKEVAVDDSQLVDWQADNERPSGTGDEDFSDLGRKR